MTKKPTGDHYLERGQISKLLKKHLRGEVTKTIVDGQSTKLLPENSRQGPPQCV